MEQECEGIKFAIGDVNEYTYDEASSVVDDDVDVDDVVVGRFNSKRNFTLSVLASLQARLRALCGATCVRAYL